MLKIKHIILIFILLNFILQNLAITQTLSYSNNSTKFSLAIPSFFQKIKKDQQDIIITKGLENWLTNQDSDGYTPLMNAIDENKDIDLANYIIKFLENKPQLFKKILTQQESYPTPLLLALQYNPEIAKNILEIIGRNKDFMAELIMDPLDIDGHNALMIAAKYQPESVQYILKILKKFPISDEDLERFFSQDEENALLIAAEHQPKALIYMLEFLKDYPELRQRLLKDSLDEIERDPQFSQKYNPKTLTLILKFLYGIKVRYKTERKITYSILLKENLEELEDLEELDDKIRLPDTIRLMAQPYLKYIFDSFQARYPGKNIRLFIIKYDSEIIPQEPIKEDEHSVYIEISEHLEKLLTHYYYLCKNNPNAEIIIEQILYSILTHQPNIQIIEDNPDLPLQIKKLLNPDYIPTAKDQELDISDNFLTGNLWLQIVYVMKRMEGNEPLGSKAKKIWEQIKDKLENIDLEKILEEIGNQKKHLKALIKNLTGIEIIEEDRPWTLKSLERICEILPLLQKHTLRKAQLEEFAREEDAPILQNEGGHYQSGKIVIGSSDRPSTYVHEFMHSLQYETYVHEFIQSLQYRIIPKLQEQWQACIKKDNTFISDYAVTNWAEDMSESGAVYFLDPDKLKFTCPARYKYLFKIFSKKEYQKHVIRKHKHKGVYWAIINQNITMINYFIAQNILTKEYLEKYFRNIWINEQLEYFNILASYAVMTGLKDMKAIRNKILQERLNDSKQIITLKQKIKLYPFDEIQDLLDFNSLTKEELAWLFRVLCARGDIENMKKILTTKTLSIDLITYIFTNQNDTYHHNLLMQAETNKNIEIQIFILEYILKNNLIEKIFQQKEKAPQQKDSSKKIKGTSMASILFQEYNIDKLFEVIEHNDELLEKLIQYIVPIIYSQGRRAHILNLLKNKPNLFKKIVETQSIKTLGRLGFFQRTTQPTIELDMSIVEQRIEPKHAKRKDGSITIEFEDGLSFIAKVNKEDQYTLEVPDIIKKSLSITIILNPKITLNYILKRLNIHTYNKIKKTAIIFSNKEAEIPLEKIANFLKLDSKPNKLSELDIKNIITLFNAV